MDETNKCEVCGKMRYRAVGEAHPFEDTCFREGMPSPQSRLECYKAGFERSRLETDQLRADTVKALCGEPMAWANDRIVEQIGVLQKKYLNFSQKFHHANSEWQEEKKRAVELNKECEDLRSSLRALQAKYNATWDQARAAENDRDEKEESLKAAEKILRWKIRRSDLPQEALDFLDTLKK